MGKAPPANPGSPATPKKGGKIGGAVSNGLPLLNGKGSSAAVGAKMSPAAQKMSTIASTVASLQVIFHQESIETKIISKSNISGQPSNICWPGH